MKAASKLFCLSAGIILLVTGVAKVWSAFGHAELLRRPDPIFALSFGDLMLIAGMLELAVAGICLLDKSKVVPIVAVSWLGASLLTYRLGLWWIGWHRPCACLGNLTDAIHLSPYVADNVMKGVLAYFLFGSNAILFWYWRQRNRVSVSEVSVS